MIELKHADPKPGTHDVIVVGTGPTGHTLSRLLAGRGNSVAVANLVHEEVAA
jgi:glycerol-3-phosphate dehydrogenase